MGWGKQEYKKEFICKQCGTFLDTNELIEGNCPDCENDEDLFINDGNED